MAAVRTHVRESRHSPSTSRQSSSSWSSPRQSASASYVGSSSAMSQRYIANNFSPQVLTSTPGELLVEALEQTLKQTPPLENYTRRQHLGGLFTGYTGLAYLFFQVAHLRPGLEVLGEEPLHWARLYLDGDRGHLVLEKGCCGLASEKLAYEALVACVTGDLDDVIVFLSNLPAILGPYARGDMDPFPSELAYGRSGALYLLRMIWRWVPESALILESPMRRLAEKILATDDGGDGRGEWLWHGKRYFGAAHGDIGIMTQLVLAVPSTAERLTDRMRELLSYQLADGNWPSSESSMRLSEGTSLVQWCHGAPGFIASLQAIRPHFPSLELEIAVALAKAKHHVWTHGLLIKEPSLCHGILGNALVLPLGPEREHFLALATPSALAKVKHHEPKLFAPADYDKDSAVLMNYWPSAAWTWAVCEQEAAPLLLYTDV